MENFNFINSTKIYFGEGCIENLERELIKRDYKKPLIIYGGSHLEKSGLIQKVEGIMDELNLDYSKYSGVEANPTTATVSKATEFTKKNHCDFILAVGGGSVIDVAKAVSIEVASNISISDAILKNVEVKEALPIGTILTIAGSGSESSSALVVTIEDGLMKRSYDTDLIRPAFSFLDPTYTYTLPKRQLISGGCDILMHTLERYFTPTTSDTGLIDGMSESLLKSVMSALRKSVINPEDYDARSTLMWAGNLSHNGLLETGRTTDWACHRMEHELSGLFNVVHGEGLSAIWPTWARYVMSENPVRFQRFAVEVMNVNNDYFDVEETALEGIRKMESFLKELGLPTSISELDIDITEEDLNRMVSNCLLTSETIGSFKRLNAKDIMNVYKEAIGR